MRKVILGLVFTSIMLLGCTKEDVIDINIRVKNVSDVRYDIFSLSGEASLEYMNIAPDSLSKYQPYASRMFPNTFLLVTPVDTMSTVVDFVMVGPGLENGFYTFEYNKLELVKYVKD